MLSRRWGGAVERRFAEQDERLKTLENGQSELRDTTARIEAMLAKLLEGQAVLHQNDMELKRRLDERK